MKGGRVRRDRLLLGLLAAAALVLALTAPASAAGFTDIDDSPFEASINALAYRGFINGKTATTYNPNDPLQRQQFAKMAVLTMGYEVTPTDVSTFKDTPAPYDPVNYPLYPGAYVAVANEQGIIKGYTEDNTFRFTKQVTRQQVITVVVRAAGVALTDCSTGWIGVVDYADPAHWNNVRKAEFNGLLDGIPDLANWDVTKDATRGEAAELLAQLFYRTGTLLTLTGPSGTQDFTMADLKALPSTEGYGGWKNKVGTIVGPRFYKGVAVRDLMDLVGGGTKVTVTASDGYEIDYETDAIDGRVDVYDPITGAVIPGYADDLTMILAYEADGDPLTSDEGGLRIGFVGQTANQVTYSGSWAKLVASITVE